MAFCETLSFSLPGLLPVHYFSRFIWDGYPHPLHLPEVSLPRDPPTHPRDHISLVFIWFQNKYQVPILIYDVPAASVTGRTWMKSQGKALGPRKRNKTAGMCL